MPSILLMTLRGRKIYLQIGFGTTCFDLKKEITKKLSIPEDDINLFFKTKKLDDNSNIMDLKLKQNDFLTIHQGDSFITPLLKEQKSNSYPRAIEGKSVPTYEEFHHIQSVWNKDVEEVQPEEEHIDLIDGDPYDFETIVKSIMELGFPKDKIIDILRRYNYDKSQCIDILLTGKEPQKEPKEIIYDVSDLNMFDFGELAEILETLTNHQKHDLLTLCRTHQDPPSILQIFVACDYNIEAAEHALLE